MQPDGTPGTLLPLVPLPQRGQRYQTVRINAPVRPGRHEFIQNVAPQFLALRRLSQFQGPSFRLVPRLRNRTRLEHIHHIVVALQVVRALQPRNCRFHLGVQSAVLRIQHLLQSRILHQLAHRHHKRIPVLSLMLPQRPQNLRDFAPPQPVHPVEVELPVRIVVVEQQDAVGLPAIAPRPACLLDVVFNRSGHVTMDNHSHVLFVHAHAKRIRCRDHLQIARNEPILHFFFLFRRKPRMVVGGFPPFLEQKFRSLPGLGAGGTKDNRPTPSIRAQSLRKDLGDFLHPLEARCRLHHFELQPRTIQRSLKERQIALTRHRFVEGADLGDHFALGRGRHIHHRRHGRSHPFADEPLGVEIIRAEIMPPFGKAVGLVKHPRANLALRDRIEKRPASQLLRRNVEQRNIAHGDAMQHVASLQRRQQPIQCRRAPLNRRHTTRQLIHLIFHQGLQRRQNDRQHPPPLHPRQRRQLEAERFSSPRRQNRQQRFPSQRHLHDLPLQAVAVFIHPEIPEFREPAFQPRTGIELLSAPRTRWISARHIPQPGRHFPAFRKLLPHPARQYGPAIARHRKPRQYIRQRHPLLPGRRQLQPAGRRCAPIPSRTGPDGLDHHPFRRSCPSEHPRAAFFQAPSAGRAEPVQRAMKHRIPPAQFIQHLDLAAKQLSRQNRIAQRIVFLPSRRLVVLFQSVIRIPRKTQRRQLQRVHHRQLFQQGQIRKGLGQHRQVMPPNVVARNRLRAKQSIIQTAFQQTLRLRLLPQPRHAPIQRLDAKPRLGNAIPFPMGLQIQKQHPFRHALSRAFHIKPRIKR